MCGHWPPQAKKLPFHSTLTCRKGMARNSWRLTMDAIPHKAIASNLRSKERACLPPSNESPYPAEVQPRALRQPFRTSTKPTSRMTHELRVYASGNHWTHQQGLHLDAHLASATGSIPQVEEEATRYTIRLNVKDRGGSRGSGGLNHIPSILMSAAELLRRSRSMMRFAGDLPSL